MTEITIIKPLEEREEGKEEREVVFAELANKLHIPLWQLTEIGKVEDEFLAEEAKTTPGDILMINLRKLLEFSNIYPVVKQLPPAFPVLSAKKVPEAHEKALYTVECQITDNQPFLLHNDLEKLRKGVLKYPEYIGLNNILQVSGILVDSQIPFIEFRHVPHEQEPNIAGKMLSGHYVDPYLHRQVFAPYFLEEPAALKAFAREEVGKYLYYPFEKEEQASKLIVYLLAWCADIIKYTDQDYIMRYVGKLYQPFMPEVLIVPAEKTREVKSHKVKTLREKSKKVEKKVEKVKKMEKSKKVEKPKKTKKGGEENDEENEEMTDSESSSESEGESTSDEGTAEITSEDDSVIGGLVPKKAVKKVNLHYSPLFRVLQKIYQREQPALSGVIKGDIELPKGMAEYLDEISKIVGRRILNEHDMYTAGLGPLVEKITVVLSKSTHPASRKEYEAEVKNAIESLRRTALKKKAEQENHLKNFAAFLEEQTYEYLYIQKFGMERFEAVMHHIPGHGFEAVLNSIDKQTRTENFLQYVPKERSILQSAYKREQGLIEAKRNFRAPWAALVHKMRFAVLKEDRWKAFLALKKFIFTTRKDDWLRSRDGYAIICPHVWDLMQMEEKNKTLAEIKSYIMRYAGDTPLYQAYYCKICGEKISYREDMEAEDVHIGDVTLSTTGRIDEDVRDNLRMQVVSIVRNNIEFRDLVTPKYFNNFIDTISDVVYNFVHIIEKKLLRVKTSTSEEIQQKIQLFSAIYVYALLVKIVRENYQRLRFSHIGRGFEKIESGRLLDFVLQRIVSTQNVVINALGNITDDFIQTSLHKAYENLTYALSKSVINTSTDEDYSLALTTDPLVPIIARLRTVITFAESKQPSFDNWQTALENNARVSSLLGKALPVVKKEGYSYQDFAIPKFPEKPIKDFYRLLDTKNISKEEKYDLLSFLRTMYLGYYFESIRDFLDYLRNPEYRQTTYQVKITHDAKDPERYQIISQLAPIFKKLATEQEPLVKAEKVYLNLRNFYYMQSRTNFSQLAPGEKNPLKLPDYDPVYRKLLAFSYGYDYNPRPRAELKEMQTTKKAAFHRHDWKIPVFVELKDYTGSGSGRYKADQLYIFPNAADYPKHPKYYQLQLVDKICSICLYPRDEILEVVKDPIELLNREILVENFFNYYTYRCPKAPEGEIFHNFSGRNSKNEKDKREKSKKEEKEKEKKEKEEVFAKHGTEGSSATFTKQKEQKCEYCAVTNLQLLNHDEDYFEKYVKVFQKLSEVEETPAPVVKKTVSLQLPIGTDVRKWKYNNNIINEFVQATYDFLHKISHSVISGKKNEYLHFLLNLGLTEQRDFEDLLSGQDKPFEITDDVTARSRILRLEAYIRSLIVTYETLRNHKNLPHLPPEIKAVIDRASGKVANGKFSWEELPEISSYFGDYYTWNEQITFQYRKSGTYYMIANFLVEYLFTTLLGIYKTLQKSYKNSAEEFIYQVIHRMWKNEKNLSKMNEQRERQVEAENPSYVDMDTLQGDASDSLSIDRDKSFATSTYPDPFGYEEMDYDGTNEEYNT